MNFMKNFSKLYLFALLLLTDFMLYAQPGDDDGNGGLEGNDPPPAPINSKLILLLIIGLIFAFYTIKKYRKQVS